MSKTFDVPVLMYHSIGNVSINWKWNYLTCPYQRFESQLKAIKFLGYNTISLNKLHDYMVDGSRLPKKSIAITFDDGYADIWVYAYPLLKKYGMCGTVFVNPEFVDPRNVRRPIYTGEKGKDGIGDLNSEGYLSWSEIKTMDEESVVFTESHALTHTWYPVSDRIIDFRHRGDNYLWMTWNQNKQLKHLLQYENQALVRLGQPVYENGKSLLSRRYFPDRFLDDYIIDFVSNNGGEQFFHRDNWKDILFTEVEKYKLENGDTSTFETIRDFHNRIEYELRESKVALESELNREISVLCWPGGSATKEGMKIADKVGYKFFNAARDLTLEERRGIKNVMFGGNRMKRITPVIYFNGEENENSVISYANFSFMVLYLWRNSGSLLSKVVLKVSLSIAKLALVRIR